MLFTVRNHEPFEGSLGIPGGFSENGESFEEALTREVYEETGLKDCYEFIYFASYPVIYTFNGVNWECITAFFYGKLKWGEVKISDQNEIKSLIWIEPKKDLAEKIKLPDVKKAFLNLWERKILV
jgi:ADP-ribose pyrophosphatase YjhB (NUDIX family)